MFVKLTNDELLDIQSINLFKNLRDIKIQKGWIKNIKQLGLDIEKLCEEEKIDLPEILQIKSKFGTLRFYYNDKFNNERLKGLISDYHKILDNTCEICGSNHNVEIMIDKYLVLSVCEKHKLSEYKSFKETFELPLGN